MPPGSRVAVAIRRKDDGARTVTDPARRQRPRREHRGRASATGRAICAIQLVVRDITEQKEAERNFARAKSGSRWRCWRAGGRLGLEPRNRRGQYSARWKQMLGYADEEIEPHVSAWERLVHPDDRVARRPRKRERGAAANAAPTKAEFRLRHKDGHYVHVLSRGFPVRREPAGPVVRIVGTHLDLTERKRAEAALRENEERLRLAFAGAQEGVWDWNLETGAVVYSARWKEMLGYADDEIEPHVSAWERLLHPDDWQRGATAERKRQRRREDLRGRIPAAPQGRPLRPRAVARLSGSARTRRAGRPHRRHALRSHGAKARGSGARPHASFWRDSCSHRKTSDGESRARCTISSASSLTALALRIARAQGRVRAIVPDWRAQVESHRSDRPAAGSRRRSAGLAASADGARRPRPASRAGQLRSGLVGARRHSPPTLHSSGLLDDRLPVGHRDRRSTASRRKR